VSGYTPGNPDLNQIYENPPAISSEQCRLNQAPPRKIFTRSGTCIEAPSVPSPSQETVDEANLRAALTLELSPGTFVTDFVVTLTDNVNSNEAGC
jgi:hypothetical protein